MNRLFITILFFSAVSQIVLAVTRQETWPPHEIACVYYDSQLLIISKDDEVAVVHFYSVSDIETVKYAYRLLDKDGKMTKGKGELVMKWKTIKMEGGKTRMIPDRDFTTIKAGHIELLWSANNKQKGWFWYIPEAEVVQFGDPTYFEDIALSRFRKKSPM